jgi:hypothetical protein
MRVDSILSFIKKNENILIFGVVFVLSNISIHYYLNNRVLTYKSTLSFVIEQPKFDYSSPEIGYDVSYRTLIIATLKSKAFQQKFIDEHLIGKDLLALKSFAYSDDKTSETYTYDESIYDLEKNIWLGNFSTPDGKKYLNHLVATIFRGRLEIEENKQYQIINVSFSSLSPFLAKDTLEKVISEVVIYLKSKFTINIDRSTNAIDSIVPKNYTQRNNNEVSTLLYEMKYQSILVGLDETMGVRVISPAQIPEETTQLNSKVIYIFGFIFSFTIGIIIPFLYKDIKNCWGIKANG